MKSLLFSMPDIYPVWRTYHNKIPSLGLVSIAGNCPNHSVYVGDLVLKRRNVKKAIIKAIKKYCPDVIGLSAMTFQFPTLIKVARFIKEINPSIPIIIGGYHATCLYKETADDACSKYFDFMIRGEADLSFNEFLNEMESGRKFNKINGLSYKNNSKWFHNPPRKLEDLENIKFPDRNSRIWKGYHGYTKKLDTIETSRGCLNYCKFCSIKNMYSHGRREYSINRVIQDIKNARKRGVNHLFFVDDNLTGDIAGIKRFEKLLDSIIENKLDNIQYSTQASWVGIGYDERIVKKMRKAGFCAVFLGIENVSSRNLKYYKKGNIIDYTKRAIKFLRDNNMLVFGGIINGMEEDKEKDFKINFQYLIDSKVENILAQILTPYPKTELRDELLNKGLISNKDDWEYYSGYFANINTKHLSSEKLNFLNWKYSNKYYKWRDSNVLKSNLFKNFPYFVIRTFFIELIKKIPLLIKKIGKDEYGKFKVDFENTTKVNKDLI